MMKTPILLLVTCGLLLSVASSDRVGAQGARAREGELLRQLERAETAFRASLDLAALYRDQGRTDDAVRMLTRAITVVLDERRSPTEQPARPPLPPDGPVRVGGDIRPPERLTYVAPVYPAAARARRLSGSVLVEFVIDTAGYVGNVRVLKSSPPFDAAAVDAVKQWRFKPTLLNGRAVSVLTTATVEFQP